MVMRIGSPVSMLSCLVVFVAVGILALRPWNTEDEEWFAIIAKRRYRSIHGRQNEAYRAC